MNHVTGRPVTVGWDTRRKDDRVGHADVPHDEAIDLNLALHLDWRDSPQHDRRMTARAKRSTSRCPYAADWID
jgi:hypothetical protein